MLVEQGSYFGSTFANMGAHSSVEVQRTGINAHCSLGLGERYHQPVRNTYRKIMIEHPQTDTRFALAASVNAIGDALGPESLVPSALVIAEFPNAYFPSEVPGELPTPERRAQTATSARKKMEKQMALARVKIVLQHIAHNAVNQGFGFAKKGLVWREKIVNLRICNWLSFYIVSDVEESKKQVHVNDSRVCVARHLTLHK